MSSFAPRAGLSLSVTTSSAAATLSAADSQVRIVNEGPNTAYVIWGATAQTATTSDGGFLVAILPSTVESFTKGGATSLAAISTGSATLRISTGVGE